MYGCGPSVSQGIGEEGDEERRNPPEPLMNQAGHPQDPCTNVSGGYPMATIHSYTLGGHEISSEHPDGPVGR